MKTFKLIFEKQLYHYLFLAVLLAISILAAYWPGAYEGTLWNLPTSFWFWLSIGLVIAHQLYVWLVWRFELHLKFFTRKLGKAAFPLWSAFFMIFLVLRFLLVFAVGYSNKNTLGLNPIIGWVITAIIIIPAAYTLYSIVRYFSFKRAMGIDHFDPAYRNMDLVRQGIFKYTPNAMYIFALAVVWIPALVFASKAALIAAFFNHAYIWVHYYTVELPDMRIIYGDRK